MKIYNNNGTYIFLTLQLGRYWSREERKRHLEKERERRRRHEQFRRQQLQQTQQQPHHPTEEPPPALRTCTLENGVHQSLWRDHSSRRKTPATLDSAHRKSSIGRKRETEEGVYGAHPIPVPANPPPPPPHHANQLVKGLLSVTTV